MPQSIPGMMCAAISLDNSMYYSSFANLLATVSPERTRRLKRLAHFQDMCNSMLGELLARYLAGFKLNVLPSGLELVGERSQRPYIGGHPEIAVSIAHSENYVLAVIDDGAVGVDIERIRPIDLKELTDIIPADGAASFSTMEEQDRWQRFYEVWTAFESYYKATGLELSDEQVIRLISGEAFLLEPCFRWYRLDSNYCATVYSVTQRFAPRFDLLSLHALISAFDVH